MIKDTTVTVHEKGQPKIVTALQIDSTTIILKGKLVRTARLKDEWYEELKKPQQVIEKLRNASRPPDLFTFWQRLPDIEPIYEYPIERVTVTAVPIRSFEDWWSKQLKSDTRNKARRATKRGVDIRRVDLSDEFVCGVMDIYNETPVRRGKPFWHYGKDFETVKEQLSRDLVHSQFIGAYFEGSLIGFVKLLFAEGRFANPVLILSKLRYRNKYTTSALIAEAVKLCAEKCIPYLTYGLWRRGSHAAFLRRHGFRPIEMPRYWIPLTTIGVLALRLGFHRDLRSSIPEPVLSYLLGFRQWYYSKKYVE